jgi:eukaryotic-like serine/threonine-protein kinase
MSWPQRRTTDGLSTLPVGDRSSDPVADYAPGDLIADKYRLTSLLGEGGMGSVWLARNQTLHVDVALKLIRRDVARDAKTAARLLQEARATARLNHPSIVRVHDYGETSTGDPFIVMELLDGEPLDEVLTRGPMPATRAVQMLLPIVSALVDAHELGVVHRDIKPENVILVADRSGSIVPKLVDFGIAKIGREKVITGEIPTGVTPGRASELKRRLTMVGTLVGSPEYMSPEQARADSSVDERADIWSLCVVLYELVSGRRPFEGAEIDDVLINVLCEEPRPFTLFGAEDANLWQICDKGLEKIRENRWPSAQTLGVALARWLLARGIDTDITGGAIRTRWLGDDDPSLSGVRAPLSSLHIEPQRAASTAPPPAPEQGARWATYGIVATTVALVGVGLWLWGHDPDPVPAMEAAAATDPASPVASVEPEQSEPEGNEPEASAAPIDLDAADDAQPDDAQPEVAGSGEPPAATAAPLTGRGRPATKAAPPKPRPKGEFPIPTTPDF